MNLVVSTDGIDTPNQPAVRLTERPHRPLEPVPDLDKSGQEALTQHLLPFPGDRATPAIETRVVVSVKSRLREAQQTRSVEWPPSGSLSA